MTYRDVAEKVCLCAGVRSGNHPGRIALNEKAHSILRFRKKKQKGYRIEGMDYIRAGDVLNIQGGDCYVMETETVFRQNDLNCACLLPQENTFQEGRQRRWRKQGLNGITVPN